MTDHSLHAAGRQISVPFHGASLSLIEHDAQPYTPMKAIVDGMGLAWQPQHRKLTTNRARWGITDLVIPSGGGCQATVCMPLRKLPGWLMTLEPNKIRKAEVRDRVIKYQNECDDALWGSWNRQSAVVRRTPVPWEVTEDKPLEVAAIDPMEILRQGRWLMTFQGDNVVWNPVPRDAYVVSPETLPHLLRNTTIFRRSLLPEIIQACEARMG